MSYFLLTHSKTLFGTQNPFGFWFQKSHFYLIRWNPHVRKLITAIFENQKSQTQLRNNTIHSNNSSYHTKHSNHHQPKPNSHRTKHNNHYQSKPNSNRTKQSDPFSLPYGSNFSLSDFPHSKTHSQRSQKKYHIKSITPPPPPSKQLHIKNPAAKRYELKK